MTDKELRKLSRLELVKLLLEQTKKNERLQQELDDTRSQLEDKHILLQNAGSIAEAAVQINKLMEAAQRTADQYVESVKKCYETNH